MTIQQQLEALAESLIVEAMKPTEAGGAAMPTKERVDIFKATSAWYLGVRKIGRPDSDDDTGGTFAELQQRINGKETTQ